MNYLSYITQINSIEEKKKYDQVIQLSGYGRKHL